ncbi:hypothetical protein HDA39_007364 [Kribbella italica]|uniref:Uncharacterized protein n=1 Tax=Kribbella italica TaxID=1540520 RepID=A0A7W9MYP4_9ACTN|nr:hypothetical protein [Kribbella italica]MBB5840630.1 hypothetical protein [Kribbella italica]
MPGLSREVPPATEATLRPGETLNTSCQPSCGVHTSGLTGRR